MHEALFWKELPGQKVQCRLCRFSCVIKTGARGRCGVRENRGGKLYSLVYGKAIAENIDPIEKKPLFHFLPGSRSYSIATAGCNFRCLHCQNYQISQATGLDLERSGLDLPVDVAVAHAAGGGCASIAYTYTEPTVYFEYAFDMASLARERGIRNVFVTNGYTGPEALEAIAPLLDAANVDLKGFREEFYREVTGASLNGVLDTLRLYVQLGIWLEVTTLVIPGGNDSEEELRDIARFIAGELGLEVPWHITAFYPAYKMLDRPRTPASTLRRAREIGFEEGLHYVYVGNIPGEEGESTFCPSCGAKVIDRSGFFLKATSLRDGICLSCGGALPGVWK
ncbi:MAG: AmmeMemoRadiSam system radical SAM enzyme [Deltaproteobacteria bacterium]|nr:AmmeMemoRadiSam system radical SAM enzyme [Deltaproteobacteria bacterium]